MIESKCNGNSQFAVGAKVACADPTYPKQEGGLGLTKLVDWNLALVPKCPDCLFFKSGSLWVAWFDIYILKNRSQWSINMPQDFSWSSRKILKARSIAWSLIKQQIGNGNSTYLWWDNWQPTVPLLQIYIY